MKNPAVKQLNRSSQGKGNFLFLLGIWAIGLTACSGEAKLRSAEDSLLGTWRITEIYSDSLAYFIKETGTLGTVVFSEDQVDYSFTRRDTLYEAITDWELERKKRQEMFFIVGEYTLFIDEFVFRCEFGDDTKGAEKNATRMQWEHDPEGDFNSEFMMVLEKE